MGTCTLVAYLCHWGIPGMEWHINNESWCVKVGLTKPNEPLTGLDCRFQVCLNVNQRPWNTQEGKLTLRDEYTTHVSSSDSPGCGPELCLIRYHMAANPVAWQLIHEPCDIFWYRYSILVRLCLLPNGITRDAVVDMWDQDLGHTLRIVQCTWSAIICLYMP